MIRLRPEMPFVSMLLVDPHMQVTHEWQPLAAVSAEVEQRVEMGHFELGKKPEPAQAKVEEKPTQAPAETEGKNTPVKTGKKSTKK